MAIRLRPASLDDAPFLERWDQDPDVINSHGPDAAPEEFWRDEEWRAEIAAAPPWRRILIAEDDGRPIGVIVDIDPEAEETHYWGDCGPGLRAFDTWIGEARDRGRGLGTAMMKQALAIAFADPAVRAVIIDPIVTNTRALRYYERCGFRPLGERVFGDEVCLVMMCERPAGD